MRTAGSAGWWKNYLANMLLFLVLLGAAIGSPRSTALPRDTHFWLIEFCAASILTMILTALPTRVRAIER